MTPGATTWPGENRENLDRRAGETTHHGEQVRWTRKICDDIRKETTFKDLVEQYHQKGISRDKLLEEFKKRLKWLSAEQRAKMGITSAAADVTDSEIEKFLSETKCFDNQLMSQIESDVRAKDKARENMVGNCLEVAHDEYGDFSEDELRTALKKEEYGRLRTFLEVPKYRKTYIKKLPGSQALKEKNFNDINFDEITRAISKMDPSNPKRREIQEAWLKIAQVAHPEKNLANAFHEITHEWAPKVDIAGAYGAFFWKDNTLVSEENREKILNFLLRQYVPLVPFGVLESLDPKSSKNFIAGDSEKAEFAKNLPADTELAEALKKDKEEQWTKTYKSKVGGGKNLIGTRSLPFETKVRLLSQFGSVGNAEKMLAYYRGTPDSLRASTDNEEDFREKFKNTYNGLDPEKLDTKAGLVEELTARLGHRVEGLEHFDDGCIMQWKTKNEKGEEIIGYYIIDSVPGDSVDEENIITARFLGNNTGPLSASGLARHYTGADFYNYLDGCAEDGKITFRTRDEFEKDLEKNEQDKKYPRYFTEQETQAELRNQFPNSTEVVDIDGLNYEIDQLLNPKWDHKKEAKSSEERKLHEGMIFCKVSDKGTDTFQVKSIDDTTGTITLWDGWGTGKKSIKEMSFNEFLLTLKLLKKSSSDIYRVPTGGKPITANQFNFLCGNEDQYEDQLVKKMKKINIREEGGKNVFGQTDPKTGIFTAMPVIKVGDKRDLYIESIEGSTVTYRRGTFKQGEYDKEKDKWTQDPEFSGSPTLTMSLEMLWTYLQNNQSFELDKPIEKAKKKEKKEKDKGMSWWNILKHTHSLGVIMHGDLWKAPFKAWEEQHHKDHAFAGKITAALAMEKLDSGGGIMGWAMNKMEWPSLMVADGNGSFQSYLDELVNKVDGMGSYHRGRLIKKWSKKEHFPSVKFMAAMMSTMKIFGQLYPWDGGGNDYKTGDSNEWFWYNSICHSLDPSHNKYPHMPPHGGDKWPEKWTKEGFKMTETDVIFDLLNEFRHPLLKNLGRRFQKYMMAGNKDLSDGGVGNLNQRTTKTEKLDWMMNTAIWGKLPELFWGATELWLTEWYSTAESTMPYSAVLFWSREEQMMSFTRESIKAQFQSGYHVPQFVFMQNKDFWDIFRETGIAFAYTISPGCWKELERLTRIAQHNRLSWETASKWKKDFTTFWKSHWKELMHKLSGMRDPMLNLMINDPVLFDDLLEKQPPEKKEQYKRLKEKQPTIKAYYQRLADTHGDATSHATIERGKWYYAGDHFRFRKGFDNWYPIAWINWDNYLDPNLEPQFGNGSDSKKWDGIFNEIQGFLESIPDMAKDMAKQMGFEWNEKIINDIAGSIYKKNVEQMKDGMEKKIKAHVPEAEYCSMPAVMLWLVKPKLLKWPGDGPKEQKRYEKYFEQMKATLKKAEEIENTEGFWASIKYRARMARMWSEIILNQVVTEKLSLEQIYQGNFDGDEVWDLKRNMQARSGTILADKLDKFDALARKKDINSISRETGKAEESDELALAA